MSSHPVTEIALFPLKAGTDLTDLSTSAAQAWQDIYGIVLEQEGTQTGYWGTDVENPTNLRFYLNWDSLEKHKEFMARE